MCVYCVYGCMDSTQLNYNSLATCPDPNNPCIPIVYGCTDSTALNYYSAANVNNGTCIYCVYGCTNPAASNYNSSATCDDGSCIIPTSCTNPTPAGLFDSDMIHDRGFVNWDDMNSSACMVLQYRVRYRVVGTSGWSTKTLSGSGLCQFGFANHSKRLLNLTPASVYEYQVKAWYCGGGNSGYSAMGNFNTLSECPNVTNFVATVNNTTKVTFSWDTTASYSFVRIKFRETPTGSPWQQAGGFGVNYPLLSKAKNGLTPGASYFGSARTWCNPSGGPYRATAWSSPLITWTMPTIRIEGENTAITNLEVYPNPSRDVFNISFISDEVQNLGIRIINVVGEAVYTADLEKFIGEFTKEVSLSTYPKGVYFLEITTGSGVINKKLILQ